ncbi:Dehydrogenase/reductase SDR family member 7 [Frankliniella fusca]|uniref:Dehydrogenase/reductase SDR family member 7 n=1 Tax=Frankliniella fusca TaxID=407009 RepID=A0AAE1LND5_9NEOP|nr:Dehydrogenase/reductase SDR family member 7 [Frankliniella fusca]
MDFFALIGLVYILYLLVYLVVLTISDCDLQLAWMERFGHSIDRLRGKVVWITGASSGIGKALAIKLAEHGCKLVLSARNRDELLRVRELCLESGKIAGVDAGDILVLKMDMLEYSKHQACLDKVIDHFGRLDILVNNAGRSQRAAWESIETSVDRQVFEINVFSVISLSRVALKQFLEQGSGHLAVTSSIAGVVGVPFSGSYTGSKFAVHGFFESLRTERMTNPELKISLLCPGPVFTNFLSQSFTNKDGEVYGQDTSPTDNRMTAERCAHLFGVALANNLDEAWMAPFPIIPIAYLFTYFPNVARGVAFLMGTKRFHKLRDSRESLNAQNSGSQSSTTQDTDKME